MSGGVSPQFLKFKGLLAFFDEMGKDMACTLDDIQEQAPHYFNAIKEHISQAGKALITSKTFWVNLIGLTGIVTTAFGLVGDADWVKYEAAILGVVNIFLRVISGEPINAVFSAGKVDV